MKAVRLLALIGAVVCSALIYVAVRQNPAPKPAQDPPRNVTTSGPTVPQVAVPLSPRSAESSAASDEAPPTPRLATTAPPPQTPQKLQRPAPKGKEPIKDPLARQALAWVGCNEEAEAYWLDAINDLTLSAQERQDLIEDLNEDGISDPKHPTLGDLPVILNRLELVELLAPQAMDQVNADAFMEAYKDLVNLAQLCVGAGEPVR